MRAASKRIALATQSERKINPRLPQEVGLGPGELLFGELPFVAHGHELLELLREGVHDEASQEEPRGEEGGLLVA